MDLRLPVATWHPNPLDPGAGRSISYDPFLPGESIAEYALRQGWDAAIDYPSKAFVGGAFVEKLWWLYVKPKPGVPVSIHAAVSGDDSDVGQLLMTVAIIVASVYVPGAMGLTAGTEAYALASAAISIGGSLVMNALFKPPDPTSDAKEEDKTYTISSGSNSLRHYDPVMLLCGRRRVFPDIDEKPYTYFRDNDQYLHQTFNFGLGTISLGEHKIGEATLDALGVSDLEVGDTTVSNVDSEAGNELKFSTGWVTRTSPADTVALEIDLGGVLVNYSSKGASSNATVDFQAEYSPAGQNAWAPCSFPAVVVGYTPVSYEQVLATLDPWTGAPSAPPAGDGWELWDDSSEWFYGA